MFANIISMRRNGAESPNNIIINIIKGATFVHIWYERLRYQTSKHTHSQKLKSSKRSNKQSQMKCDITCHALSYHITNENQTVKKQSYVVRKINKQLTQLRRPPQQIPGTYNKYVTRF